MSKPFDAATKRLLALGPDDWLRLLGLPGHDAAVIDADLSTVTASADRLLRVPLPKPYVAHIEMHAGKDVRRVPLRLLRYNVLSVEQCDLPVQSVLVLLRPEADNRRLLTGTLEYRIPDAAPYLQFQYTVVRIWELPLESILNGGIATLPLAPLARDAQLSSLPGVVRRMQERFAAEVPEGDVGELWTATKVLMGLRFTPAFADTILKGAREMKESSTYRAIVEEGRVEGRVEGRLEGERRMFLLAAERRLGAPSASIVAQVNAVESLNRLEYLMQRLFAVETWDELLANG